SVINHSTTEIHPLSLHDALPILPNRLRVDRKDAARRAVLGRHVRDRRPIGERQSAKARAVELDELADDAALSEHLRHGENEVGRDRKSTRLNSSHRTISYAVFCL